MDTTDKLADLQSKRQLLLQKLALNQDFRPGSLVARYRKCGKPYCHCAKDGSSGHGPSWSLTRPINGKTFTKIIPLSAVEQTKAQIAEYHLFQLTIHELVEVNVQICDALLELQQLSPDVIKTAGHAEKRGSKRKSAPPPLSS